MIKQVFILVTGLLLLLGTHTSIAQTTDIDEKLEKAMEKSSHAMEIAQEAMERAQLEMEKVMVEWEKNHAKSMEKSMLAMEEVMKDKEKIMEEAMATFEEQMGAFEEKMKVFEKRMKAFESELKAEMLADGLIKNKNDKVNIKFKDGSMEVDGEKVSDDMYKKYKAIMDKYEFHIDGKGSFNFNE